MTHELKLLTWLFLIIWLIPGFADDKQSGRLTLEEPLSREKNMVVFIKFGNGYLNLEPADEKTAFEGAIYYKEYRLSEILPPASSNPGSRSDRRGTLYSLCCSKWLCITF